MACVEHFELYEEHRNGWAHFMRNFSSERGASLVEYSLVVMLVAAIAIGGVAVLGGETADAYDSVGAGLRGETSESSETTTTTSGTTSTSTTSTSTTLAQTTTTTTAATTTSTTQAPTTTVTQAPTTTVTTVATTTTTKPPPGYCSGPKRQRPPGCP
jgi:Flp pilus assembly pilin Flp